MNRAFLEAYNRELALLYEGAKEFAEDFPGIAESRLWRGFRGRSNVWAG
mgnify:CR=1 FL=1